jgi:hypothetical protein
VIGAAAISVGTIGQAPSSEPTIEFLGIVVPDESQLFLAIVAVHVVIALTTVVVGVVAPLSTSTTARICRSGKRCLMHEGASTSGGTWAR